MGRRGEDFLWNLFILLFVEEEKKKKKRERKRIETVLYFSI